MSINNQKEHKYTTGQTAQFFGVSLTTLHSWIQSGRLVGGERTGDESQVQIPESAIWISSSGEGFTIKEIVRLYQEDLKSRPSYPTTHEEERQVITDEIEYFERKYGGTFAETFGDNPRLQQLSEDKRKDADEWLYWLQRLDRMEKEE